MSGKEIAIQAAMSPKTGMILGGTTAGGAAVVETVEKTTGLLAWLPNDLTIIGMSIGIILSLMSVYAQYLNIKLKRIELDKVEQEMIQRDKQ